MSLICILICIETYREVRLIYIVQNLYEKVTTKLAAMALTRNVHSGMPCGGKMAVDP